MCDILYTYRDARRPISARERRMTKAEKMSHDLKIARHLGLLVAGMLPKKRENAPRAKPLKTPPMTDPTDLPEPFAEMGENLTPEAQLADELMAAIRQTPRNLFVNNSLRPRRLFSGATSVCFNYRPQDEQTINISLCLTSETRGYVEFHPIAAAGGARFSPSTTPLRPIRLHYVEGKNTLSHTLRVSAACIEGYRLYLPPEFGDKTVWCESATLELRIVAPARP